MKMDQRVKALFENNQINLDQWDDACGENIQNYISCSYFIKQGIRYEVMSEVGRNLPSMG